MRLVVAKGTEYEFRVQAQNEENYGETAIEYYRTEDGGRFQCLQTTSCYVRHAVNLTALLSPYCTQLVMAAAALYN